MSVASHAQADGSWTEQYLRSDRITRPAALVDGLVAIVEIALRGVPKRFAEAAAADSLLRDRAGDVATSAM